MDSSSIAKYYNECYGYTGNSVDTVGWFSADTQEIRFEILSSIADLTSHSVLDVGCGLGNFYEFVTVNYENVSYTGIDVADKLVAAASKNYPAGKFFKADLSCFTDKDKFDYVFASGTFNIANENNYEYLASYIKIMWKSAKKGVAFNLLSSYSPEEFKDPFFYYYEPEKVFSVCKELAPYVILRHDYLPNDVTFIMWKKNAWD